MTEIMFKGTFAKIGVKNLTWVNYANVTAQTPEKRDMMLRQTERRFAALHANRPLTHRSQQRLAHYSS